MQMIFPWMFDEICALRPLKDVAHLLNEVEDWPPLYDINSLNNNQVLSVCKMPYSSFYMILRFFF
jgi:hypothetical protein